MNNNTADVDVVPDVDGGGGGVDRLRDGRLTTRGLPATTTEFDIETFQKLKKKKKKISYDKVFVKIYANMGLEIQIKTLARK